MKFATATLAVLAAAGTVSADNWLDQLGNSFKNKGQEIAACAKASSQLSCNAKYDIPASSSANCCFNGALVDGGKQSGLILSTSFWTTTAADPANNGPKDSTTIHGLWPDCECLIRCRKQTSTCILTITLRSREYGPFFFFFLFFFWLIYKPSSFFSWIIHNSSSSPTDCDATYPAFCSAVSGIPEYTGAQIVDVMAKYDPALKAYYDKYFKDLNGDAPSFLEHEYNKHGTCYTTMRPSCQPKLPWISQADFAVLNYFRQIAHKFAELPTYDILKAAGIVPDANKTYQLADVQAALKEAHGATPFVGCNKKGEMNEFWYFNFVQGSVNFGRYEPTESTTKSTCPATLKYLPKP